MAFPLALAVLLAGGGALLLFSPKKKTGTATGPNPILVPAEQLPAPPGAVGPTEMPGGPPQVIVAPPAASQPALTPQQQVTQALPNLVQQVQQALPQLFPQPAATPPVVKTVPAPGETSLPPAASTAPNNILAPPAAAPAAAPVSIPGIPATVTQQLPQVLTNVITQAAQATQATPLQQAETQPAVDTNGTIALAKKMIDREASAGWKSALQTEINAWEARVGLPTGGKFGEGDAKRMAQEVGVLPLVRYWPKNTLAKTEVPKYRAALEAIAASVRATNPAHAAALTSSAAFETGRTYGTDNPAPVDPSLRQIQANALQMKLTG